MKKLNKKSYNFEKNENNENLITKVCLEKVIFVTYILEGKQ